ncbi:uncharacterized protein [Lepisosteus oculatus]|uniref:uncharacterized protein isoform X1 n=1 Tax=Lepisosteus oculatus TaxID=7918 RepID=UPI0035F514C3
MRTIVGSVLILLLATAAPEQTGGTDTSTTATVTGSTAATATSSTAATATGSTTGSSTASTAAPTSSTATGSTAGSSTASTAAPTSSTPTAAPASSPTATPASSATATPGSNTTVTSASSTTMTPASNTTATPVSNTTATPASNTTAVTSTTTGAPVPVTAVILMELNCSLNQDFTSDLSDSSSAGFKNLSANVEKQFNATYLKKYPTSFRGYKVKRFWPGSVVQSGELTFSNTSTVPSNDDVAQVLKTAVQNGDVTLPVNTTTISVSPAPASSPTATPASNTTATPASNTTMTSASNTTAVTSTTTGAPVPVTAVILMELNCSLNQNFTNDLSNSSSAGFQNLSGNVEAQFNATYLKTYPTSFRGYKVKRFWPGSVVQSGEITFTNTSTVPSNAEIAQVLKKAVQNGDVTLPVNTTTISVSLKQVINPTSSTTKSGAAPLLHPVSSAVFWVVTVAPAVLLVSLTEGLFPLRVFA